MHVRDLYIILSGFCHSKVMALMLISSYLHSGGEELQMPERHRTQRGCWGPDHVGLFGIRSAAASWGLSVALSAHLIWEVERACSPSVMVCWGAGSCQRTQERGQVQSAHTSCFLPPTLHWSSLDLKKQQNIEWTFARRHEFFKRQVKA